jgi:hypothetical protein
LQVVFPGVGEENVHIIRLDWANPEEAKDLHIQAAADSSRKGIPPSLPISNIAIQEVIGAAAVLPSVR